MTTIAERTLSLLVLCLAALLAAGFRPMVPLPSAAAAPKLSRSLSMKQVRIIRPEYPLPSPENTLAYLQAEKEKERLEEEERQRRAQEREREREREANTPSAPTPTAVHKPKSLTQALRLMQQQWRAIGVGAEAGDGLQ